MARCNRCNRFMFFASQSGQCKNCSLPNEQQKKAEKVRINEEELKCKNKTANISQDNRTCVKSITTNQSESEIYPHVITLKQMFADFFPKFKLSVIRNDDAWQFLDTSHLLWIEDAINLKRAGDYIGSCKLYFEQVLNRKAITLGWASGIIKTLASAGDISDAIRFGLEWYEHYSYRDEEIDAVVLHLNNILKLVAGKADIPFAQYLKEISGNPNYTVNMYRTDLYTDGLLQCLELHFETLKI